MIPERAVGRPVFGLSFSGLPNGAQRWSLLPHRRPPCHCNPPWRLLMNIRSVRYAVKFVVPFCVRSAPPDIRGSGKERGHGTELTHCPKCNKTLKPGKHHVGCSGGKTAPRQAIKRSRVVRQLWCLCSLACMKMLQTRKLACLRHGICIAALCIRHLETVIPWLLTFFIAAGTLADACMLALCAGK